MAKFRSGSSVSFCLLTPWWMVVNATLFLVVLFAATPSTAECQLESLDTADTGKVTETADRNFLEIMECFKELQQENDKLQDQIENIKSLAQEIQEVGGAQKYLDRLTQTSLSMSAEVLTRAESVVGKARDTAGQADEVANKAHSSSIRTQRTLAELEAQLTTNRGITRTLEGVENLRDLIAKNPEIQQAVADRVAPIPKHAVIAVDIDGCPPGWQPFEAAAGRLIIGAGKGGPLTNRKYRDVGGAENHELTIEEMPAHAHSYELIKDKSRGGQKGTQTVVITNRLEGEAKTEDVGGSRSHNNMPPFIVLYYCKKE